ncbi:MAG: MarR family transcriptional regulator [Hyphomicrobiales bacterium]|nr:MarR family transcriptional regulator [Hyphomicrobiales bacterium]
MAKNSANRTMPSAELSNRIFFRLYQCANMMHKTGTRALEEYGVTTQQWAVLGALTRPQAAGGMLVGDLARFLMVSRQNLTGVINRMERDGYIERVKDSADGRSRRVRLTAKGEGIWQSITPLIYDYYGQALADISRGDRDQFLRGLDRLLANLERL